MGEVTILPGDRETGPFGPRDDEHYLRVHETGWEIQHSTKCYDAGKMLRCVATRLAAASGHDFLGYPGLGTWRWTFAYGVSSYDPKEF